MREWRCNLIMQACQFTNSFSPSIVLLLQQKLPYPSNYSMKKFMNKLKGDSSAESTSKTAPLASSPGPAGVQVAGVEDPFAALRRYDTGE